MGKKTDQPDEGHFARAYSLKTGQETRDHYRDWAQSYDREVGDQNGYAQPARVADMLLRVQPDTGIEILDAGCGSGLSGEALRNAGYRQIDGCDFSSDMLAQARRKDIYRSLETVDLNTGLNTVSDERYGAVVAVGVFSYGHVEAKACDEFVRILSPGGWMIIALNAPFWEEGSLKAKLEAMEKSRAIRIHAREFGEHLPGHDVKGWVIAAQKS